MAAGSSARARDLTDMPLDPYAKRFLDRLAALNPPSALSLSVAERREALGNLLSLSAGNAPESAVEDRLIPGPGGALPVRIYTPGGESRNPLPALIYFHGGGLVAGTLDTYDGIARELAHASGCRLISVGYRLAPEAPFPAAVEDACAATAWIAAHADEFAADPARIGVAGDSAGATLAAVACQQATANGVPLALQVLLCPILDHAGTTPSRQSFAQGHLVDAATLGHDLKHYLGSKGDVGDPRVSPSRGMRLRGLPPTIVHTAEFDPLRDEGRDYAERLKHAGVTTLYRCHLGMIHLFYGMGGVIPYAATAYREIGADIRSLLKLRTA
jgi:acetyl esterase